MRIFYIYTRYTCIQWQKEPNECFGKDVTGKVKKEREKRKKEKRKKERKEPKRKRHHLQTYVYVCTDIMIYTYKKTFAALIHK